MPVLSTIFLLATAAKNSTTPVEDGGVTVNETLVNKIWLTSGLKNTCRAQSGLFYYVFCNPISLDHQKLNRTYYLRTHVSYLPHLLK